jgi:hypothetical protein
MIHLFLKLVEPTKPSSRYKVYQMPFLLLMKSRQVMVTEFLFGFLGFCIESSCQFFMPFKLNTFSRC